MKKPLQKKYLAHHEHMGTAIKEMFRLVELIEREIDRGSLYYGLGHFLYCMEEHVECTAFLAMGPKWAALEMKKQGKSREQIERELTLMFLDVDYRRLGKTQ